jgi:hypothetical protein
MVCCIASLSAPNSAPICGKAGKMVSIENGPNIASPPRIRASRRLEGRTGSVIVASYAAAAADRSTRGGCILPLHGGRSARAFGPAALPKAQPPGIAQARDRRVTTLWRDRQHRTMRGRRRRGKTCVATLPGPRWFKLSGERTERGEQGFRAAQAASLRAPMRLQAHGQGLTSTLSAIFPSPSP